MAVAEPVMMKVDVEKMTNGERFRRGLGPAKPKRRGCKSSSNNLSLMKPFRLRNEG